MLTIAQITAILGLLLAFGADDASIKQVATILTPVAAEVRVINTPVELSTTTPEIVQTTKKLFTGDPKKLCRSPQFGIQYGENTFNNCKIWLAEQL